MIQQSIDPAAATAAYLAQVPPEVHARATAFTHGNHWLLLWGFVVTTLVAVIIIRLGLLKKIQARIERNGQRPILVSLAVAAVYILVSGVLSLPWSIYAVWWRRKQYGLTSQPFGGWLTEAGMSLAIDMILSAVLVAAVYALIRRAPRWWWLWSGGFAAVFLLFVQLISPVYVEPLFNTYTAAPEGEVRDAVSEMARASGVPSSRIYTYDGSRQSNAYNANVAGLGGTARIAMSDVMFAKGADMSEVRAVVGHEIGHYVKQHAMWSVLFFALLLTASFWVIAKIFPAAARLLGAHDVTGIADPAGLPVLFVLTSFLTLAASPITNAVSRAHESAADTFSLELVNEPDGMSKALVKTVEFRNATPGRMEEIIFYTHPSVSRRIRRAMEWKASQGEQRT